MKILKNLNLKTNSFMFSVLFEDVNLIEFQKITSIPWVNFIHEYYLTDIVIEKFKISVFKDSVQIDLFFTSIDEINDYDLNFIKFLKNKFLND